MTKFVIVKPLTCTDSANCSNNIILELETLTGAKLQALTETEDVDGHISISHAPGAHKIWCFLYDTTGKHESEAAGKDVIQDNPRARKFTGTIPSVNDVRDAIKGEAPP